MTALAIDSQFTPGLKPASRVGAPGKPRPEVRRPRSRPPFSPQPGVHQAAARSCRVAVPRLAARPAEASWQLTARGLAVATAATAVTFAAGLTTVVAQFLAIPA